MEGTTKTTTTVHLTNTCYEIFSFSIIGAVTSVTPVQTLPHLSPYNSLFFQIPGKSSVELTLCDFTYRTFILTQLHSPTPQLLQLYQLPISGKKSEKLKIQVQYQSTYTFSQDYSYVLVQQSHNNRLINFMTQEKLERENLKDLNEVFTKIKDDVWDIISVALNENNVRLAAVNFNGTEALVATRMNKIIGRELCACGGTNSFANKITLNTVTFAFMQPWSVKIKEEKCKGVVFAYDPHQGNFGAIEENVKSIVESGIPVLIFQQKVSNQEADVDEAQKVANFQHKYSGLCFLAYIMEGNVQKDILLSFLLFCSAINLTPSAPLAIALPFVSPNSGERAKKKSEEDFVSKDLESASILCLSEERDSAKNIQNLLHKVSGFRVPIEIIAREALLEHGDIVQQKLWIIARNASGARIIPEGMATILAKHAENVCIVLFYWFKQEIPRTGPPAPGQPTPEQIICGPTTPDQTTNRQAPTEQNDRAQLYDEIQRPTFAQPAQQPNAPQNAQETRPDAQQPPAPQNEQQVPANPAPQQEMLAQHRQPQDTHTTLPTQAFFMPVQGPVPMPTPATEPTTQPTTQPPAQPPAQPIVLPTKFPCLVYQVNPAGATYAATQNDFVSDQGVSDLVRTVFPYRCYFRNEHATHELQEFFHAIIAAMTSKQPKKQWGNPFW